MKGEIYPSYGPAIRMPKLSGLLPITRFKKKVPLVLAFIALGNAAFAQSPLAENDQASTGKNMPVTIKVLANDASYVTENTAIQHGPAHGMAEINKKTGIINYWPATDYTGKDQFSYLIKNSSGTTATAIVNITITDDACSTPINGNNFSWNFPDGDNQSEITQDMVQPAASNGFVFDNYKLDNSFNMIINGTKLATEEIQFQSDGTDGVNIQYQDGESFENGRSIWTMVGDSSHPTVRVKILPDGEIKMFVVKSQGGHLYPVELIDGAVFNSVTWNPEGNNNITVTQMVSGPTVMEGRGYGLNVIDNPVITLNSEGGQAAIEDPASCGTNGSIHLNISGVEDGVYDLTYQGGSFQGVQITAGKATISAPAGTYNNITIGSGNCQSADGLNAELHVFPCTMDDVVSVDKGNASGNVLDNDGNGNNAGMTVTKITIGGTDYLVDPVEGLDISIPGKGDLQVNADGSFAFQPDPAFSGSLDEIIYTVDNGYGTTNTGKLSIMVDTPLPVSGVQDFEVTRKGTAALLSWSTVAEIQNKGFRAERSADGNNWHSIGLKNSLAEGGNSTQKLNYNLVDPNAPTQTSFYRIVQIDLNGKESVVSGVKILKGNAEGFSVYPNPAADHITLVNASGIVYIYDVSGRVVLTKAVQPGVKNLNLNIQGLAKGIYFVKSGEQRIKLIKK